MKNILQCPICRKKHFIPFINCLDFSVSKEEFKIVMCIYCKFLFTNPRPTDNNLSKYYLSEDYISHTNSTKGVFSLLYQKAREFTLRKKLYLVNKLSKRGRLLDIGCGTGEFLNICNKNSWITNGIEPSDIARNQAINKYNLEVNKNTDLLQFDRNSFDIITMWHVLEHISKLNETIKHLYQILDYNGKIIIAVPNYKSWDASYYKEFWAAYDVPIHLWHFSKNTITTIFKNNGFYLSKTKGMILDSFYVSLLSEKYKYGKMNFIAAFIIGFISNIMTFFSTRGYSSSIYIFKKNKAL